MADETTESQGTDNTKTEGQEATPAPEETKAPEGEATPPKETPVETAPESYEAFKMPEGAKLAEDDLKTFSSLAKESGLSQEKAQKVLDLGTKALAKQQEAIVTQWKEVRAKWVQNLKADKEYGGPQFPETIERAQQLLNKYGSDEFKRYLDESGYGDNPELIKMLAKISKALGEDVSVDGEKAPEVLDAASIMYPNQGK